MSIKDSAYTPKERYIRILNGKEADRPSCSCPLQTGTMELMEKTGAFWPIAHKDPNKMADLALGAWRFTDIESVRIPFCLTVEAEALGCGIDLDNPKSQPSVQRHILADKKMINEISVPDPENDHRMPVVGEATSILKEKVGEELPVIVGILSPFTLAGHLRGVENLLLDIFDDPDFLDEVLSFAKDVALAYSNYLVQQGADSICLIDPSATTELIGPDHFAQLASPRIKAVVDKLKVPSVLHICGDTTAILEEIQRTGAEGISIDHIVDAGRARSILKDSALVGNINPIDTLLFGNENKVLEDAEHCLKNGVDILAPGCGISPRTSIKNILAYTSYVRGL